jgi:hypothetical protein
MFFGSVVCGIVIGMLSALLLKYADAKYATHRRQWSFGCFWLAHT